MKLSDLA